ncbi:GL18384 [Drosophila persimilis]|uniref:GL18384 n=1 Tax=Drosophila persimilis TaxID=7234 RepID=B4H9P0_DROPE|nr:GL18384 [Drosophila persimilis]
MVRKVLPCIWSKNPVTLKNNTPTGKKLLSEYQLNLLTKTISRLRDFHDAEDQKLHKLLAIKVESVLEIKKELDTFVETVNELDFGTGIEK